MNRGARGEFLPINAMLTNYLHVTKKLRPFRH
jgi:hypothetical protein